MKFLNTFIMRWKSGYIYKFTVRLKEDHVSAYAAQMAYFIIMAFIPFVLFLTAIVRYTPLTYGMVREAIIEIVPLNLQNIVLNVVAEIYGRSDAVLPVSALIALWTAGKGMQSMIRGMNTIYHVKETRNWFMNRVYSVIYMMLFVAALVLTLILLVLGNYLQELVFRYIPIIGKLTGVILETRKLLVLSILFLIFLMLYKFLPNRKSALKNQVPGAVFTAIAWLTFSFGFSVYFDCSRKAADMYGSLTALIMLMLWLYICMYLTLIGAEINVWFENEWFRKKL